MTAKEELTKKFVFLFQDSKQFRVGDNIGYLAGQCADISTQESERGNAELIKELHRKRCEIINIQAKLSAAEQALETEAISFAEWKEDNIEDTNDHYTFVSVRNPKSKRYYHKASKTWSNTNAELFTLYKNRSK